MRYYLRGSTLFVRGKFRAVSTGIGGTIRNVSTILNKTVPDLSLIHISEPTRPY